MIAYYTIISKKQNQKIEFTSIVGSRAEKIPHVKELLLLKPKM